MGAITGILGGIACWITGAVNGLLVSAGLGALTTSITSGPIGWVIAGLIVLVGYRFVRHHIIWVTVLFILPFLFC